jgi:hypothetical protein
VISFGISKSNLNKNFSHSENMQQSEAMTAEDGSDEHRRRSLEKAYNSPQNKTILQSFRYMRNKPTIIAFKTPSLEAYEKSKVNTRQGMYFLC